MGVYGLHRFVQNNEYFDQIEDIRKVVKEYKKKHEKMATIIFDINGIIYSKMHGMQGALGERHFHFIQVCEHFFYELIAAGAELVFFSDGQVQTDKHQYWCEKKENRYSEQCRMLSKHITEGNQYKLIASLQVNCPILVQSVIRMIKDRKLGKVYIVTEVECDRAIAKYALDNEALAIVSCDTDFLIFNGNYQLWFSIDFVTYKVKHLDREKIRASFGLNWKQMRILATMAGNDFTKPFTMKRRARFHLNLIENIANFIRNSNIKAPQKILSRMRIEDNEKEKMEIIRKSIKFYDVRDVKPPKLNHEFNAMVDCFKHDLYFPYDVNSFYFKILDGTTNKTLVDSVMEVFKNVGGILLQDDQLKKLKILTKFSPDEKYCMHELRPNFEINHNDDHRNKLLWCLGLDDGILYDLGSVLKHKTELLLPILSILFLTKIKVMDKRQATAMLIAHYRVEEGSHFIFELDTEMIEIIRSTQIFLRICSLVRDCFFVCDLEDSLTKVFGNKHPNITKISNSLKDCILPFDGVYYASLLRNEKFMLSEDNDFDGKQVKDTLKKYMMQADTNFIETCDRLLMGHSERILQSSRIFSLSYTWYMAIILICVGFHCIFNFAQ